MVLLYIEANYFKMKNIIIVVILLISNTFFGQTSEEWRLTLPSGTLQGTLLTPKAKKPKVVLLIPGSGPTDRNGNSATMQNNSLKMLAENLAKHQIATLRIDKRSIAQSKIKNFNESEVSFDDFINDAVKWIDTLKQTHRFSEIWVAGHSQGSLVGMIAAKRANATGFISLAGAGSNIGDVIKEQLKYSAKPIRDFAYKALDSLQAGKRISKVPPLLYSLFRPSIQPFWISWMKYNPTEEIQKLKIPVLIINGTTDLQVSVDEAYKLHNANPVNKIVIIDGMNHILKKAPKERQANLKTYADPDLPLHSKLVPAIVNFMKITDEEFHTFYNYPFIYLYHNGKLLRQFEQANGEEVKNLEYKGITKSKKGFNLTFQWGGFNYSHLNTFIFKTKKKQLFLVCIETKIYENMTDKTTKHTNKIKPILLKDISLKKIYSDRSLTL